MSYQLKSTRGTIEAVIDDNCSIKKFYNIAAVLSVDLKINFGKKVDNSDTLDWDFIYKKHPLQLHFNIYNGVSICTQHSKGNDAANELAQMLESRYF